jgi:hypothetical protein
MNAVILNAAGGVVKNLNGARSEKITKILPRHSVQGQNDGLQMLSVEKMFSSAKLDARSVLRG